MKRARLTVRLAIDVESNIEDDELLEIHAAEVVRSALSQAIEETDPVVYLREGGTIHLRAFHAGAVRRIRCTAWSNKGDVL